MATGTEAASLNKTECDQLPAWKYKSSPISSLFPSISLCDTFCVTKQHWEHGLYLLPPNSPQFAVVKPPSSVFPAGSTEMGVAECYVYSKRQGK